MSTVTVRTKEDLESAVKNKEDKIIITGDLASKIIKAQKKKSVAKKLGIGSAISAGVVAAAGIVAAPVTGGASAVAGLSYAVATTAGGTAIALSTTEFIVGILGVLGALGITAGVINTIAKNYNVKVSAGSTTVECTRK
ncbi:hypothetical protein [Treponema parvum]|uniref:hypothetical protein n=1 Tax=Treponema parvum TaxID=138851 RepID=UPI001AEBBD53|nr:hypothetical protein [Treponema parvum]QTQ17290.1 hypothetical protein HXT04_11680 [Treponema parvum]